MFCCVFFRASMGFASTLFVEQPVEEELLCSLCLEVFDRPVNACAQGHTFCTTCLTQAQASRQTCPQCRGELFSSPPPNRPLQNMISKLSVRCKNGGACAGGEPTEPPQKQRKTDAAASADESAPRANAGCEWTGTVEQLDEHLKTCAFIRVPCGLRGCRARVLKQELSAHQEVCEFREMACPACQQKVVARAMQRHLSNSCPERQVECKYCKKTMTASALGKQRPAWVIFGGDESAWTGHLAECSHAMVRCEFWSIGCHQMMKRSETAAHHAADAAKHASLTIKKFASMEQAMEKQRRSQRDEALWEEMSMSWEIPVAKFAGTGQVAIKSNGPLVSGFKMYLRVDVPEGNAAVKVSLCAERPPWNPVRVRELSIQIWDVSDTWSDTHCRDSPSAYLATANLKAPDYSCGRLLEYAASSGHSDSDADSDELQDRVFDRACVNDIAVAGKLKLRATFKVKRITNVTVRTV